MKKLFSIISVFILFIALTGFNPLGYIRSNEPVTYGDELEMHVNINNDLDKDIDNVRVRAYIIDTFDEYVLYSNNIEIPKGDKASTWLFWDVPRNAPKGDYLVRVVANGDGFKDVDYTWVSIY